MKVLIADDDPVALLYLHCALEEGGYDVVTASDGKSACDILLGTDAPKLAILDWMMPQMDGVDVCRRVRQTVRDRYIYLIMLTSKSETRFTVEAMDSGADDFISKPYGMDELQARLRTGSRISVLEQELRLKATHDSLTGLYNRGAIVDILKNAMSRRARKAYPLSIILADLDHFKRTNDTYGHQAGDEVLREVTRRAANVLRPYDSFGRYGGEEFLIVLPECDACTAFAVAERVRLVIAGKPVLTNFGPIPSSLSLGVAGAEGETSLQFDNFIEHADKALYQAKNSGRNRVVLAVGAVALPH
ncbi:diguanylate cyclase [Nitrosospira sp. Is2]|uniref:GGDEF domain-containing response regulator n=1 Tax=Nitrosospira sp. Is2 TaxID=3080532 RepID=UPI0029556562|nr:diguanylate cyclase [Nitrosospira sp. Is2]WON75133.1 diguanylate cyclase [Nitrosospira sp. Is2]